MRKATGSYGTYSSLVKLQPWFLSFRWKTCLWAELQPWRLNFCSERTVIGQNTLMMIIILNVTFVGQVAQAARRLATGWTARVRSRVSEGWRLFFTASCPDWSWGPLSLLENEYRLKATKRRIKHPTSS